MKKHSIQTICLFLAALMLLTLWGCGQKQKDGETQTAEQPSAAESLPTEPATESSEPASATEPPTTEPAATEPPTTEPAATEPPTTEPAATEPTTTEPTPETPVITEGKHAREPGYPSVFDVFTLTDGDLSVHMEKRIYDEAGLLDCAHRIRGDLNTILAYTGEPEPPLEVYLVSRVGSGHDRIVGSRLFCTLGELENGTLRTNLIKTVCGLPRTWQAAGLAGFLFAEETDDEALRDWYRDGAHANQLSLCEPYFSPVFADEETVRISELTARSVAADFLDRQGWEAFRDLEQTSDAVEAWAVTVLGCEAPALPAGAEEADRLTLLGCTDKQLVLQADAPMNHFRWELTVTDWLTDAEDACQLLCRFYAGYAELLETMERQLPEAFPQVRENAEREITINFVDSSNISFADWARGHIELADGISLWHEVVHHLLPLPFNGWAVPHWEAEGLADHYSVPIETKYSEPIYGRYRYLVDDAWFDAYYAEHPGFDDQQIRALFIRYYTAFSPLPQSMDELDYESYYRAMALVSLLHPELRSSEKNVSTMSIAAVAGMIAGPREQEGDGLTYPEAWLMAEYLMEQYGEDAYVCGYLADASSVERLGLTYPELYAAFLEWVHAEYDPLDEPAEG